MLGVKKFHGIVHQPVVDAGDGQRCDIGGFGGARQQAGARRAGQKFPESATINLTFAREYFPRNSPVNIPLA
jgi:hypothetical protein